MTNTEYRKVAGAIAKTAARDVDELVEKGILHREGAGRGVRYRRSGQSRHARKLEAHTKLLEYARVGSSGVEAGPALESSC